MKLLLLLMGGFHLLQASISTHYYSLTNAYLNPHQTPTTTTSDNTIVQNPSPRKPILVPTLVSLALTATLSSPLSCLAIPSLNSPTFPSINNTPFAQSKNLDTGLQNGKIRPCPSTNPGCISTNPKSSSFAFPWTIPENYLGNAIQKLKEAILKTQRNVKFEAFEDTPDGQYLLAEVDGGGFSRDVLEFLVKRDVVGYRAVSKNVVYLYPLTTALGDSKGQEERLRSIVEELGWYAPSFDAMDSD